MLRIHNSEQHIWRVPLDQRRCSQNESHKKVSHAQYCYSKMCAKDPSQYSPINNNTMVEVEYSPGSSDTSSSFIQNEALLYATEPVLMERLMEHDQKRILVIETSKNETRNGYSRESPDEVRSKVPNDNNNKTQVPVTSTSIFKVASEGLKDDSLPRIRSTFSLQPQQTNSRMVTSLTATSTSPSMSPKEKRRINEENNYHHTTSSNALRTSHSSYNPPYKVPRMQSMTQGSSALTFTYSSPISHAFTSKWLADHGNSYGYSRSKVNNLSPPASTVQNLPRNENSLSSESHHTHPRNCNKHVTPSLLIEASHAGNTRPHQNSTSGSYICQDPCCTRSVCCDKGLCSYSKDLCTNACNGTNPSPRSTPPPLQRDSDSGSLGSPPLLVESQSKFVPRGIAAVSDYRRGAHIEFISTEAICSKPLAAWTAEHMSAFIRATDCAEYADVFIEQDIDGKAVLLLDKDVFMRGFGLKIGPAMKLYRHIINLRNALL